MKVCFAAIFMDIIRRGELPDKTSIYTVKNSIKTDPQKRRKEMGNIFRLADLNVSH